MEETEVEGDAAVMEKAVGSPSLQLTAGAPSSDFTDTRDAGGPSRLPALPMGLPRSFATKRKLEADLGMSSDLGISSDLGMSSNLGISSGLPQVDFGDGNEREWGSNLGPNCCTYGIECYTCGLICCTYGPFSLASMSTDVLGVRMSSVHIHRTGFNIGHGALL